MNTQKDNFNIKNTIDNGYVENGNNKNVNKIALVFPGQGSQYKGMVKDFLLKNENYLWYFKQAQDILGEDILDVTNNIDSQKNLNTTKYAQTSIYTLSCALNDYLFNELGLNKKDIFFVAGHSLGDYSALYSCSAYDFVEGLEIVAHRGKIMSEESDNLGMAAIIGADFNDLCKVLRNFKDKVYIANYNDYNQIVLSGYKKELLLILDEIKLLKIGKAILLNVKTASHCPLMLKVSEKLNNFFIEKKIKFKKLTTSFFSSTSLSFIDNRQVQEVLTSQLINPVKWVNTIEKALSIGINVFIEVGPSKVLTNLIRRICEKKQENKILTFCMDNFEEIERINDFLKNNYG